MTSHNQLVGDGVNLAGEACPRCGHRTHRAEFGDDVWNRCVTDDCPRGWYDADE